MITPPRFARNAIYLEHGLCCFDARSRAATAIAADPTDRHSECAIGPDDVKPPGQLMLPRIAAPVHQSLKELCRASESREIMYSSAVPSPVPITISPSLPPPHLSRDHS